VDSKHRTAQLERAFASTRAVLAEVGRDRLDAPTPCASWDVRDVINHVVESARWATAAIGSTLEEAGLEESRLEDAGPEEAAAGADFLVAYDECVARALAAFAVDGALERAVRLDFGEFTGRGLMGIAATDQFVHGWDLARALGRPTDLDPELAEELLAQVRVTVPDEYRGPDGTAPFGPVVEPPAGAGRAT
jgi:uncharacterized protein (TIGR03086 family)